MATLLVRNVDDMLVKSLRELAARHGRSAEAEHREILAKARAARDEHEVYLSVVIQSPSIILSGGDIASPF